MIAPLNPNELKIEITDACNLRCSFCYLGEKVKHFEPRFMPEEEVFHWIDWAVDNGIPGIRFTGGEAVLHPQIEMFCYYAHILGRYIILNTNGMADDSVYRKLIPLVNDIRISLPTLDSERMDVLTGKSDVLKKKKKTIEMVIDKASCRVCLITPLIPDLHGKLEAFIQFCKDNPRLFWMPLRYEPTPLLPRPWTPSDAQCFAEEMDGLMEQYPEQIQGIYLATPFCSVKPTSLGARVFHGRAEDCGPFAALNIHVRGYMQACFDICKIDNCDSLSEVKDCPEISSCLSLAMLPVECSACGYVSRCAGGCRKSYGLVHYNGRLIDYLAGFLHGATPN